ncbi:MAG: hypothetical protein ACT4QC_13685 [Planctomycetaceae bacterium]
MNRISCEFDASTRIDLERVVEPLASYICAADRPRAALVSALQVLFSEVEATNRAAVAHCGAFLERCSS